jgi:hypothetical protein
LGYRRDHKAVVVRHYEHLFVSGGALRRHIYLQISPGVDIPINLIWRPAAGLYPVMLCLQGTRAGANRSWGEARAPPDPVKISAGADYALQAADRGYLALCIDQTCYDERQEREDPTNPSDATFATAICALQLGRTLLGERVADVIRVIDWLLAAETSDAILPG